MGITGFVNNLIANLETVFQGLAGLAAIAAIVIVAIVTNGAWAKMIVTTLAGAFLVWAVTFNGLGWFSKGIQEEVNLNSAAPAAVVESTDHDAVLLDPGSYTISDAIAA